MREPFLLKSIRSPDDAAISYKFVIVPAERQTRQRGEGGEQRPGECLFSPLLSRLLLPVCPFLLFKAAIRFLSVREREVQRAKYKADAAAFHPSNPAPFIHPSIHRSNNRINKHLYSALERRTRRRRKGTPPMRCSLTASPMREREPDCQADSRRQRSRSRDLFSSLSLCCKTAIFHQAARD